MSTDPLATLVRAIYFDTNVIKRAGNGLDASWFQKTITQAKDLGIRLYMPRVVLDEWKQHVRRSIQEQIAKFLSLATSLNRLTRSDSVDTPALVEATIQEEASSVLELRLAEAGVEIIPTALPAIEQLLISAVQYNPPFDSGGKGFKDAIILHTVAEHMAANHRDEVVFVACDDSRLCEAVAGIGATKQIICCTEKDWSSPLGVDT